MKKLKIIDIKNHIAILEGYTCFIDLSTCGFGNPSLIKKIGYFLNKTKYGSYIKEDIKQKENGDVLLNVGDYWNSFCANIRMLDMGKYF